MGCGVCVGGGGGENRDETECVVGGKSSETETEKVVSKTKSSCIYLHIKHTNRGYLYPPPQIKNK